MILRPERAAERLIGALDTAELAQAERLAAALAPYCRLFKVGLELFCAAGPAAVRKLARQRPIFLDLKLHDIPHTVAGAIRALLPLAPAMLTLHAAGGPAMVAAARAAVDGAETPRPLLLAVTVLTSLDAEAMAQLGFSEGPAGQVLRLARMALEAGADGVVCSAQEVAVLRHALGPAPLLVVPGLRPPGSAAADQRRTATPAEAVAAGADWLVLGRPLTAAADPAAAAAAVIASLESEHHGR